MKKALLASLLVAALGPGCVGPNRLTRGLDEKVNQMYVDNPGFTELLFPFILVGTHVCAVVDYGVLNPYSFWTDVGRKHGTPYYYKSPELPGDTAEPETAGAGGGTAYEPSTGGGSGAKAVRPAAWGGRGYVEHVVRPGDTLSSIARRYYGDASLWKEIYRANQGVVRDPDRVPVGTVLQIPRR